MSQEAKRQLEFLLDYGCRLASVSREEVHVLFTDLGDYVEADEDPGINYAVGYLNGVADAKGVSVLDLLGQLKS